MSTAAIFVEVSVPSLAVSPVGELGRPEEPLGRFLLHAG